MSVCVMVASGYMGGAFISGLQEKEQMVLTELEPLCVLVRSRQCLLIRGDCNNCLL